MAGGVQAHALRVFVLLAACGGSKPASVAPLHDSPAAASVNLAAEPFQLAAVVYDRDLFASPPQVTLPSDASFDLGSVTSDHRTVGTASLTYSMRVWTVRLDDDFDRFERDIAPRFAQAKLPESTALVWSRQDTERTGPVFTSIAIHVPPLLATGDLASAEAVARPRLTIDLDNDQSTTEDIHVVNVTLTLDAATRYARWTGTHPGEPIAIVVFGRVATLTNVSPRESETTLPPTAADVTSFVVEFQGVSPGETRVNAAALAKAVAQRVRK